MNFDANTIATLMQLLNADKQGSNTENNACNAPKTVSTQSVDKSSVQNAFYAQNGIGEQVRIDFSQSKPKSPLDMLDTGQNPMLSMLKSLSGGKNDMSSILPMLMSLMSKQPQKSATSCTDNSQSAPISQNGNQNATQNNSQPPFNSQNLSNGNSNGANNAPYSNQSTQMNAPYGNQNTRTNTPFGNQNVPKNAPCDNKKTQRDVFEPVAFAGYEVISTLAALLTAVRRPCR